MSEENVEVVRRGFEAFNRGGPEAVIGGGFWSPEIAWDTTPRGIPGLGVYRGQDEVRSAFEQDWFKAFPFACAAGKQEPQSRAGAAVTRRYFAL